ncbi:MAG: serine/threonine protein kinase [Myxococcales bacterium]|nr:serine/threonine protein kinase [Myxococcales bacterium]
MDPLIGVELDGRFRLLDELGEGAMGKVYRAQRLTEAGFAAIKVLNEDCSAQPDLRERFEREARALFGLSHPHILDVQDYGLTPDGRPYLVMELLEGQSLEDMVENAVLPPEQALALGRQVIEGLAFAHAQGVLHRDLKSENVFVTRRPDGTYHAKLLDFGLVKFMDDERWGLGRKLTIAGSVMGSPAYMSPEQATGGQVDARADVYSAGVVLYELVTGRWPFEYESRSDMLRAHLIEPPPAIAGAREGLACRPELEAIVRKALAKDADDRFADAREMLTALDAIPPPAAWLDVQAGQRAPLAGGALPAFSDPGFQIPPAAQAPIPAPPAASPMAPAVSPMAPMMDQMHSPIAPLAQPPVPMAQPTVAPQSNRAKTLIALALAALAGLMCAGSVVAVLLLRAG